MTGGLASVTLLLFGAALVKLGVSDDLLLYVRPVARPWVLLAGLALLLLAGWSLLAHARDGDRPDPPSADQTADPHDHGGAPRTAWLVLAPVVAVLIIAPPALGQFTADHAPPVNAAATGRKAHLDAGPAPVALHILSFMLLSTSDPAALQGRQLTLVGFVQKKQSDGFTLARLIITCCAADASTGSVTVLTGPTTPGLASTMTPGSWVQVTGTFGGVGADVNATPRLSASTITAISQPTNPYD